MIGTTVIIELIIETALKVHFNKCNNYCAIEKLHLNRDDKLQTVFCAVSVLLYEVYRAGC